jgi:hypothetical protein
LTAARHGASRDAASPLPGFSGLCACLRRTRLSHYAAALVPPALILALAAVQPFVPVGHLTRDPMVVAGETGLGRAWYGMISNLGILGWSAAVGASLLGAAIAYRDGAGRRQAAFLACGAGLGAILAADDLFMVHESHHLAPAHGERVVVGGLGVATLAYLVLFRREILGGTGGGLLLVALMLFSVSVGIDLAVPEAPMDSLYWVAEDGSKFMGIAAWAAFQFTAALDAGRAQTPVRVHTPVR